jgi:hypothetical protein
LGGALFEREADRAGGEVCDGRCADTDQGQTALAELTPTLKLPTADIFYMDKPLDRNAALERMQASKRLKTSAFSQVALKALPDKQG